MIAMFADPTEFLFEETQEALPSDNKQGDGEEEPTDYEAELRRWEQAPEFLRKWAENIGYLNALRVAAGYQPVTE